MQVVMRLTSSHLHLSGHMAEVIWRPIEARTRPKRAATFMLMTILMVSYLKRSEEEKIEIRNYGTTLNLERLSSVVSSKSRRVLK